ncbi:MAG TPA: hypothetical protein VNF47_27045 [Streptosporangiaceae bacterium]|nr:hypothetical protein [Streptosporangiaceae bacterium]
MSTAFFAELGFTFSPELSGRDAACMVVDQNVYIKLLAQEFFQDYVNGDLSQPRSAGEVLTCLSADSPEQVDDIVAKAIAVGGKPWPVLEERPVYSGSFQDLDGHLWQFISARPEPVPG